MSADVSGSRVRLPGREVPILTNTDVLICGGGVAGLSAATASGRLGARTLLVERDGFLGGSLTASGMAQWGAGSPNLSGLGAEMRDRLVAMGGAFAGSVIPIDPEAFKDLSFQMCREAKVDLLLFTDTVDVVMDGRLVRGVVVQTKTGPRAMMARVTVDASGDADLAYLAGAPHVKGRESDGRMRPITQLFRLGNVDIERVVRYATERPQDFLRDSDRSVIDIERKVLRLVGFFSAVKEAKARGELDKDCHYVRLEDVLVDRRMVMVNTTRVYDVDGTDPFDLTRATLEGRRQMHQLVAFLKRYVPGFEETFVVDTAPRLGVRETRRIVGEYVLTEDDIAGDVKFPDTVARSYMRHIPGHDVHSPDAGEGAESDRVYRTDVMPVLGFNLPYRILVPRGVEGLLVAGRCMSVTQEADRWTRNQPPCILAGQAAGTAAALAVRADVLPRAVNVAALQAALARQGVDLGALTPA